MSYFHICRSPLAPSAMSTPGSNARSLIQQRTLGAGTRGFLSTCPRVAPPTTGGCAWRATVATLRTASMSDGSTQLCIEHACARKGPSANDQFAFLHIPRVSCDNLAGLPLITRFLGAVGCWLTFGCYYLWEVMQIYNYVRLLMVNRMERQS